MRSHLYVMPPNRSSKHRRQHHIVENILCKIVFFRCRTHRFISVFKTVHKLQSSIFFPYVFVCVCVHKLLLLSFTSEKSVKFIGLHKNRKVNWESVLFGWNKAIFNTLKLTKSLSLPLLSLYIFFLYRDWWMAEFKYELRKSEQMA